MEPSKPASDDEDLPPVSHAMGAILVGLAPTAYALYGLLTDREVPLWVILVAPFSLFYSFMGYLTLRLRYDEEGRQEVRERMENAEGTH